MTTSQNIQMGNRGITLIELIVVMGIAAGLLGASLYSINILTAANLRDESMRLTSAIKSTWTQAALNNAQYRLVIDFENNSYHTEVAKLPSKTTTSKKDEDETGQNEEGESDSSGFEEQSQTSKSEATLQTQKGGQVALPPPTQSVDTEDLENEEETDPFGIDQPVEYEEVKNSIIEKTKLKEQITFKKVVTTGLEKPQTKGKASIRLFPNGFMEPAIIVLQNERKEHYSIVTEPLTGRVKLYSRIYQMPDEFGQGEESDE